MKYLILSNIALYFTEEGNNRTHLVLSYFLIYPSTLAKIINMILHRMYFHMQCDKSKYSYDLLSSKI